MIKTINDDCMIALDQIADKSIDLLLTDPPYLNTREDYDTDGSFDPKVWLEKVIPKLKYGAYAIIFCQLKLLRQLCDTAEKLTDNTLKMIVWNKANCIKLNKNNIGRRTELMLVFKRIDQSKECKENQINVNRELDIHDSLFESGSKVSQRHHPNQKPVELLSKLIRVFSDEGQVVLDTFMGSGSTGLACKILKRNFIGIERDKTYYENAIKFIDAQYISDYELARLKHCKLSYQELQKEKESKENMSLWEI